MKSLGGAGKIVSEAGVPVEDALRYVFSLPIATLVSGIDSEKVLDQNLKIVRDFKPLSEEERRRIEIVNPESRRRRPVRAVQELEDVTGRSIASSTASIPIPRPSEVGHLLTTQHLWRTVVAAIASGVSLRNSQKLKSGNFSPSRP